jgi:hypothetical protein
LGVTPSAWGGAGLPAFQRGSSSFFEYGYNNSIVGSNFYFDGTSNRYFSNGFASYYQQFSGGHAWATAPSGTAGDAISFTQAMSLDANGNLSLGTTSAIGRLAVVGDYAFFRENTAGADVYIRGYYGNANVAAIQVVSNSPLAFLTNNTERARITSGGDLLVGTTTSGAKLTVEQGSANANGAQITNQTYNYQTLGLHNTATANDNVWVTFGTEASFTTRGSITYNRAGGLTAYNVTSDYRAKDIIGPVVGSGALIDSVPVYMGKMKGATQERPMFIAHEVPAYAHTGEKDAVDADGKPVYQQMDASALIPVMWAEIQSLRARLAAANI